MQKKFYKLRAEVDETEWRAIAKRSLILEELKNLNPKQKYKLLDFGCGTGILQLEISKKYPNIDCFGIDTSKLAIEFCQQRGLEKVQLCSDRKIPFKNHTFDIVTSLDVLEHIKDDIASLKEIKRVLKKSGLGIFLVPQYKQFWSDRDKKLKHFRRYQSKELEKKCQNLGFKIKDARNVDFLLAMIMAVMIRFAKKDSNKVAQLGWETAKVNNFLNFLLLDYELVENYLGRIFNWPFGVSKLVIVV